MRYGHKTVLAEVAEVPEEHWGDTGVCGVWSTKDILAHLASYELALGDVLLTLVGDEPTPYLDAFLAAGADFNDDQVEIRRHQSGSETLAEYTRAYERVAAIAPNIPEEKWRETGTIPWYGTVYSVDDLVVYQYYGHKREHCAQVAVFVDGLS